MSPSTLTRSIQRLEDSLGQTLFLRDNRTVSLTPAGEKSRAYAIHAVREWESVKEDLSGQQSILYLRGKKTAVL